MEKLGEISPLPDLPLIAVQQIRIAVLENELKHERATREAALNTSQQMLSSLINSLNSSDILQRKAIATQRVLRRGPSVNRLLKEKLGLKRQIRAYEKENQILKGLRGAHIGKAEVLIDRYSQLQVEKKYPRPTRDRSSSQSSIDGEDFCLQSHPFRDGSEEAQELLSFNSHINVEPKTPIMKSPEISEEVGKIDFLALDDLLSPPQKQKQKQKTSAEIFASEFSKGIGIGYSDKAHGQRVEVKVKDEEAAEPTIENPCLSDAELEAKYGKDTPIPAPKVFNVGITLQKSFSGTDYTIKPNTRVIDGHYTSRPTRTGQSIPFSRPFDSIIFRSIEEREGMIQEHKRHAGNSIKFPDFFMYGLSYKPLRKEHAYHRTVHIGNVPVGSTLKDIASRIRGGEIISIVLTDTASITGSMTAIVQFKDDGSAEDYAEFIEANEVLIGDSIIPITATVISSPTWPLSTPARRSIFQNRQTRCLNIRDFPERSISHGTLLHDISEGYEYRAAAIEEIWRGGDGHLHLAFASVAAAGRAFGDLTHKREYWGLEIKFERDPCDGSLDEIMEPISARDGEVGDVIGEGNEDEIPLDLDDKEPSPPAPGNFSDYACQSTKQSDLNNLNMIYQRRREIIAAAIAGASTMSDKGKGVDFSAFLASVPPSSRPPCSELQEVASLSSLPLTPFPDLPTSKHSSWADEVIEAAETSDTAAKAFSTPTPTSRASRQNGTTSPPSSPLATNSPSTPTSSETPTFTRELGTGTINPHFPIIFSPPPRPISPLRSPFGVKCSKYATLLPGFSDVKWNPRASSGLRKSFTALENDEDEDVNGDGAGEILFGSCAGGHEAAESKKDMDWKNGNGSEEKDEGCTNSLCGEVSLKDAAFSKDLTSTMPQPGKQVTFEVPNIHESTTSSHIFNPNAPENLRDLPLCLVPTIPTEALGRRNAIVRLDPLPLPLELLPKVAPAEEASESAGFSIMEDRISSTDHQAEQIAANESKETSPGHSHGEISTPPNQSINSNQAGESLTHPIDISPPPKGSPLFTIPALNKEEPPLPASPPIPTPDTPLS